MDENIIFSFLGYQELVYTLLLIHSYLHFLIVLLLKGYLSKIIVPPSPIHLWAFFTCPISLLILLVIYYIFACRGANDWWSYKWLLFRVTSSIQALPIALRTQMLWTGHTRTHCQPQLRFRCQPSSEHHAPLNSSTTRSTIHNAEDWPSLHLVFLISQLKADVWNLQVQWYPFPEPVLTESKQAVSSHVPPGHVVGFAVLATCSWR